MFRVGALWCAVGPPKRPRLFIFTFAFRLALAHRVAPIAFRNDHGVKTVVYSASPRLTYCLRGGIPCAEGGTGGSGGAAGGASDGAAPTAAEAAATSAGLAAEEEKDDLPPADVKVILLGDSAVGKSKLVERYLMDDYHPRQVSAATALPHVTLPGRAVISVPWCAPCRVAGNTRQPRIHAHFRDCRRSQADIPIVVRTSGRRML